MRNMSKEINGYKPSHKWKLIVLDGDIGKNYTRNEWRRCESQRETSGKSEKTLETSVFLDATWIESMNTVMDDNKVLTLVSNERIPFNVSFPLVSSVFLNLLHSFRV
jgi:dynein heavy chain